MDDRTNQEQVTVIPQQQELIQRIDSIKSAWHGNTADLLPNQPLAAVEPDDPLLQMQDDLKLHVGRALDLQVEELQTLKRQIDDLADRLTMAMTTVERGLDHYFQLAIEVGGFSRRVATRLRDWQ